MLKNNKTIKPFLKWVGGKGKIIPTLIKHLPNMEKITTYIEPFGGGGALFFYLLEKYNDQKRLFVINDINIRLISTYESIRDKPEELTNMLERLKIEWFALENEEKRKEYYYQKRDEFNSLGLLNNETKLELASLMIFLNKTCYNGLYRVNSMNKFNSPCGRYENPLICDRENIYSVSEALNKKNVEICNRNYSDFQTVSSMNGTLFYFDPPYMPITKTSSFTSYSEEAFTEEEQMNLKEYCDYITSLGAKFMLSNSHPENNFFEILYKDYNINYIEAPRAVAAKTNSRKKVKEVLITNY